MQATELRIGNYVGVKGDAGVYSVIGIEDWEYVGNDAFQLVKIFGGARDNEWKREDKLKGIKITEEWLINLGFDTIQDGWYGKDTLNDHYAFTWNIYDKKFRYRGNEVNTKYVHQLQNLYFALTGKELQCQ